MALTIDRPRNGKDAKAALSRLVGLFDQLGDTTALPDVRAALDRTDTALNGVHADIDARAVLREQGELLARAETTLDDASLAVATAQLSRDASIRADLLRQARAHVATEQWKAAVSDVDSIVKALRKHHDPAVKTMVAAVSDLDPSGFEPDARHLTARTAWARMLEAHATLATARKAWALLVTTGAFPVPAALATAADHPSELWWTADSTLTDDLTAANPHPARRTAEQMHRGTAAPWLPTAADLRKAEPAMLAALEQAKQPLPHPLARDAFVRGSLAG